MLGDTQLSRLTPSANLSWRQSDPRCELTPRFECREFSNRSHQRGGRQIPNAWNLLDRLHLPILPNQCAQPLPNVINVGLQGFDAPELLLQANHQISGQQVSLLSAGDFALNSSLTISQSLLRPAATTERFATFAGAPNAKSCSSILLALSPLRVFEGPRIATSIGRGSK